MATITFYFSVRAIDNKIGIKIMTKFARVSFDFFPIIFRMTMSTLGKVKGTRGN